MDTPLDEPTLPAPLPTRLVEVGDTLEGFCGGYFGRDSYAPKDVLAVGEDWVLVRERSSHRTIEVAQHAEIRRMLTVYRVEGLDHALDL